MAKKKQSTVQIAAAAARAAVEAASDEAQVVMGDDLEEEQELDALGSLAALGADNEGTRFVVKCLSPLDRKGTIEEVSREELAELVFILRDRYGPGKYSVSAFGPRGYIKGGHRVITISSLAGARAAAASSPAPPPSSEADARFERQRLEQREDRKFMLQLLVGALPVLQGILRPPSLADQAAALTAIGGLRGGSDNTEKMLETLFKGLELGKELNGGGSADSWPGLIREVVKDLTPGANSILTQIAERRAAAAGAQGAPGPPRLPAPEPRIPYQPASAPVPAPGAGGSGTAPGVAPASDHPEVKDPMLRTQLPLLEKLAEELLEFAANGADPGICAEALVAKIPRAVRAFIDPQRLTTWLTHPQWWAVLEGFKPALSPYQGYCDDVRQTLLKLMSEPESEPENP